MSLTFILATVSKLIVALSILNVWFLRFDRETPWRGGNARSLREEFEVYGLSPAVMYTVGIVKVSLALLMLGSIWVPELTLPSAAGMAVFMLGAIAMHFVANDPKIRSFPALIFLVLSIGIVALDVIPH